MPDQSKRPSSGQKSWRGGANYDLCPECDKERPDRMFRFIGAEEKETVCMLCRVRKKIKKKGRKR